MNLNESITRLKGLMGLLTETREGFMNYLQNKSEEITGIEWPDYVLRDWLYRNTRELDGMEPELYKGLVEEYLKNFVKDYGVGHWENKVLDISIDSFTKNVQDLLKKKIEGYINPDIGNDEKRHKIQQSQLEKQGVSHEPIIVIETKDGKYDLLEGWHRTTNSLKKLGNYKQNAWVYVLD